MGDITIRKATPDDTRRLLEIYSYYVENTAMDMMPIMNLFNEWHAASPFEDSLSEEQIDIFHQILDCVSETAAAEMRAAYKVGFKDGAALIREVQE